MFVYVGDSVTFSAASCLDMLQSHKILHDGSSFFTACTLWLPITKFGMPISHSHCNQLTREFLSMLKSLATVVCMFFHFELIICHDHCNSCGIDIQYSVVFESTSHHHDQRDRMMDVDFFVFAF